MRRGSTTAAELIAKLEANPEYRKNKAERELQMSALCEFLAQDQADLVKEFRAAGYNVDSVDYFVNTREEYPKAIPILIRHLEVPHKLEIREGIVRALTVKYGGKAVEEALLRHFQNETDANLRWVFANALKTAMPLARRKKHPEIETVFRRNSRK